MKIRRYRESDQEEVWALHNLALEEADAHAGNGPWDDDLRHIREVYLDDGGEFPDPADNSLHTLEVIVACHASHHANAVWKALPLEGKDRLLEIRSG